jgi:predicted nucleic acid-binding protein
MLAESLTLLKARGAVDHASALGEFRAGRLGYLVESTAEGRRRAWELFVSRTPVSRVDCASFAVMEELGLTQCFGFDEDFARGIHRISLSTGARFSRGSSG